jgi:4-hydroxy-tetrahydrodipicolinate synthase
MTSVSARIDPAADFSGLWIPLVTPFRQGVADPPAIDHAAAAALVRSLLADGAAGIVLCGSTGEAAALDDTEQLALLDGLLAAVPDVRIVMGVAGNHLPSLLQRVRALCTRRLAGLLVSAPAYIRPGQDGVAAWFRALADASTVPVLLYDIPYRTGVTITRETLLTLAAHPRIVGIKDCGGDLAKTLALVADGRLQVLAGEDLQLFTTVAAGGAGAITASAHCHTARFAAVIRHLQAGDVLAARAAFLPLLPWIEAMFAEPNPAPVKAALAATGRIEGCLRAPLMPASAALVARLPGLHQAVAGAALAPAADGVTAGW